MKNSLQQDIRDFIPQKILAEMGQADSPKRSEIQQDVRDSVSQKDYAEVYKPNFPKLSNNTKRKEFL